VSTGKKNGIVDIRGTNTQLLHSYKTLLTDDVIKKYGLKRESLKPVKVVAHVENGNRMIGALDYTEKEGALTVVMLGISNYNGKPR
jgi:hypothetical protein